jgi:hypothetical protein
VVATGAAVGLHGFVRLHVPHLDVVDVVEHGRSTVPIRAGLLVERADGIVTLALGGPPHPAAAHETAAAFEPA